MTSNLHHVHIFAADIEASIAYYREFFGGEVILDNIFAGARNVFIKIGTGRLHFYDQARKDEARGAVHHIGIQTDDLAALVAKMRARGIIFRKEIADFGYWKYIMAPAPDGLLIEVFQIDEEKLPAELQSYCRNFSISRVID
jgi:catechol 2,3-dioxygenase-like lactoylglutathione lyase family enzyme